MIATEEKPINPVFLILPRCLTTPNPEPDIH